jgi:hypothetical protein
MMETRLRFSNALGGHRTRPYNFLPERRHEREQKVAQTVDDDGGQNAAVPDRQPTENIAAEPGVQKINRVEIERIFKRTIETQRPRSFLQQFFAS